jgi:hypothetical protein
MPGDRPHDVAGMTSADDADWFDGHLDERPGHFQRRMVRDSFLTSGPARLCSRSSLSPWRGSARRVEKTPRCVFARRPSGRRHAQTGAGHPDVGNRLSVLSCDRGRLPALTSPLTVLGRCGCGWPGCRVRTGARNKEGDGPGFAPLTGPYRYYSYTIFKAAGC